MLIASSVVSNYGLCAARGRCSFLQRKLEKLLVCLREQFFLVEDVFLVLILSSVSS